MEIARLEQELEERHKNELEDQKKQEEAEAGGDDEEGPVQQKIAGLSLTSETAVDETSPQVISGAGKKSRAQKRKVRGRHYIILIQTCTLCTRCIC